MPFKPPSRNQIAQIAGNNHEMIKAFEAVFQAAGIIIPAANDANAQAAQTANQSSATANQKGDSLIVLSGVASGSQDLGAFAGDTIADNRTIKQALQSLETAIETLTKKVDDLVALSGVAANSQDLGAFTGNMFTASETIRSAIQKIETRIELEHP